MDESNPDRGSSFRRVLGLALRRRAALPAMGEERMRGESLAEEEGTESYEYRKANEDLGALQEMAGMRERLTERAIRRVVLDGIMIARIMIAA